MSFSIKKIEIENVSRNYLVTLEFLGENGYRRRVDFVRRFKPQNNLSAGESVVDTWPPNWEMLKKEFGIDEHFFAVLDEVCRLPEIKTVTRELYDKWI